MEVSSYCFIIMYCWMLTVNTELEIAVNSYSNNSSRLQA